MESYELGVQEIEVRLVDELAEVCRDYCKEVWMEAFNLARVPASSEWRQAGNVYYPLDIREVLAELPPPAALATVSSEQPFILQAPFPPAKVPTDNANCMDRI